MKRTYGGWAVSSLRTTTRIGLISDSIRTHHRRDRLSRSRTRGNCNRWHGSAACIIDTPGKQPREPAVNLVVVARSIPAGVFLALVRGRHAAFVLLQF